MGFLSNVENARKINGLVGDIRDAIVDYQVCVTLTIFTTSNLSARLRCNKIFTTRVVGSS